MHSRRVRSGFGKRIVVSGLALATIVIGGAVITGSAGAEAAADLAIALSENPVAVTGTEITYVITATNNGPDEAVSVIVIDDLPASLAFVSCQATGGGLCGGSGNSRTVGFASLAAGQSETITLAAWVDCAVADGTAIINTATIAADPSSPDDGPSDNAATAVTTASNPPPTITCPADIMGGAYPANAFPVQVDFEASAADNCPDVAVLYQPPTKTFGPGMNVAFSTVVDSGGASASCAFNVLVQIETTTTVEDASGQYSDQVWICASVDPPTAPGRIDFWIDGNARGSSTHRPACIGDTLSFREPYFILEPQGTHTVTATYNPEWYDEYQSSTGTGTLTVFLEDAEVEIERIDPWIIYENDPYTEFCAYARMIPDCVYPYCYQTVDDLCKAVPLTATFTPVGSGTPIVLTAQTVACDDYQLYSCLWPRPTLPAGEYEVVFAVGGDYYQGSSVPANLTILPAEELLSIGPIIGPEDPVIVNSAVSLRAEFTDGAIYMDHIASWRWGDGTWSPGTIDESARVVEDSHTYTQAGVYLVTLSLSNGARWVDAEFRYVVVYDPPPAAFVTGGGWIDSPAGAYAVDPALAGKLTFGFESRYREGELSPIGNMRIHFSAWGLMFQSDDYYWMDIAGPDITLTGIGTFNRQGRVGFLLRASDAELLSGGGADRIRIRIWNLDQPEDVIYDSQMNDDEHSAPITPLGGGSIVIHQGD